jgi:hypothetical protein
MIEVLKQALDALERSVATCFDQYAHQQVMSQPDHFINQAITSLRQAIAELESQKQGEPVACKECHLKDTVYDLLGDLKVANLKLSVRSQRTWVGLMRGVRVEGNTVVITVKGGNDEARALCGELINKMEKNT